MSQTDVLHLLDDPCAAVRRGAAAALGRYPGAESRRALRAFFAREPDPRVRAPALSSLGQIGELEDLPALLQETAPDRAPHIRIHALAGVSELSRRLCTSGLIPLLDHEASDVRTTAAVALGTLLAPRDDTRALAALARASEHDPNHANREQLDRALERAYGVERD